jgi:hypothetical protein
MSRAQQ